MGLVNKPDASDGILRLTIALFHELRSETDDLFFSPYSIVTALGLLEAGARGQTQADLRRAMGFADDDNAPALLGQLGPELEERANPNPGFLEADLDDGNGVDAAIAPFSSSSWTGPRGLSFSQAK